MAPFQGTFDSFEGCVGAFLAAWDPRFVHKAFSGAVLGALVVLLGILPQLHRPEASRNESSFDQSSDRFPPKGSV